MTNVKFCSVWRRVCMMITLGAIAAAWGSVLVSDIVAQQRLPWNGKVDVKFQLTSTRTNVTVSLSAWNLANSEVLPVLTVETPDGIALASPLVGHPGHNHFVWNAQADLPTDFKTGELSMCVTASSGVKPQNRLYCVIDVSGGPTAASYPVTYLNAMPEGGWSDEYKTTKIVLRKIPAGTFSMGAVDMGSYLSSTQTNRTVTLSHDFYMGIFEVTQRQYELVMGSNPSVYRGDMRPVETVTWEMLRGTEKGKQYTTKYRYAKDAGTFLQLICDKSGIYRLDLPTEAQWEYACRAGTMTPFNDGVAYNADQVANGGFLVIKDLLRDKDTRYDGRGGYSEHTTVGMYRPNSWGLYDMHGNVAEFCLDPSSDTSTQYPSSAIDGRVVIDPLETGAGTSIRGGSWSYNAWDCRAGIVVNVSQDCSNYAYAYKTQGNIGFRLATCED